MGPQRLVKKVSLAEGLEVKRALRPARSLDLRREPRGSRRPVSTLRNSEVQNVRRVWDSAPERMSVEDLSWARERGIVDGLL